LNPDKDILQRFLAGECTEEEMSQVRELLQNPVLAEQHFPEEEWASVQSSVLANEETERRWLNVKKHTVEKYNKKVAAFRLMIRVAAIVILLAGIGALWIVVHDRPVGSTQVVADSRVVSTDSVSPVIFYNNLERAISGVLPDGSEISLEPHSVIRYEADYNESKREVVLEGKAYFKVKKDRDRPFTVYANGFSTTALGTSFTVSGYPDRPNTKVALHTGKVVIRSVHGGKIEMKDVYLEPGEQWKLNTQSRIYSISRRELPDARKKMQQSNVSITGKTIDFDRVPLSDVFQLMQQYFDVIISYEPLTPDRSHFSGTIKLNDPIEKIMTRIASMHNLQLKQAGWNFSVKAKK